MDQTRCAPGCSRTIARDGGLDRGEASKPAGDHRRANGTNCGSALRKLRGRPRCRRRRAAPRLIDEYLVLAVAGEFLLKGNHHHARLKGIAGQGNPNRLEANRRHAGASMGVKVEISGGTI